MTKINLGIKWLLLIGAIIVFFLFILFFGQSKRQSSNGKIDLVTIGFNNNLEGKFKTELEKSFKQAGYIESGKKLLSDGFYDEAINKFNIAFKEAQTRGEKGLAIVGLSDVYERMKNYKKALEYVIIEREQYINDWAKAPVEERITYLKYANEGNYDLAVLHAQNALNAFNKLYPQFKNINGKYQERLWELKAAKDHILTLKDRSKD